MTGVQRHIQLGAWLILGPLILVAGIFGVWHRPLFPIQNLPEGLSQSTLESMPTSIRGEQP